MFDLCILIFHARARQLSVNSGGNRGCIQRESSCISTAGFSFWKLERQWITEYWTLQCKTVVLFSGWMPKTLSVLWRCVHKEICSGNRATSEGADLNIVHLCKNYRSFFAEQTFYVLHVRLTGSDGTEEINQH